MKVPKRFMFMSGHRATQTKCTMAGASRVLRVQKKPRQADGKVTYSARNERVLAG